VAPQNIECTEKTLWPPPPAGRKMRSLCTMPFYPWNFHGFLVTILHRRFFFVILSCNLISHENTEIAISFFIPVNIQAGYNL
ncbi:MAG TPA: hypothetical protein DEB25_01570, partial [Desulfobulbaceae bacterium]|nr:hypothetical protein [Desulfobulbaceae bacterium]